MNPLQFILLIVNVEKRYNLTVTQKAKKKKARKKKAPKGRAPAKSVEILEAGSSAAISSNIDDISALRARMKELLNATPLTLNELIENPETTILDKIILRMLKDMSDHGNLQTIVFYLDVALGRNKMLGGDERDDNEDNPVTIFELPENGSETLDGD